MKVSAKAEYACLAMLDLSLRKDQTEPIQTAELARRNGIPERFLVQILLQLKGAGLVQSIRGASGGYRLSADPQELTLLDVIRLVDGPGALGAGDTPDNAGPGREILQAVWRQATELEESYLRDVNFASLAESLTRQVEAGMYHI